MYLKGITYEGPTTTETTVLIEEFVEAEKIKKGLILQDVVGVDDQDSFLLRACRFWAL